MCEIKTCPVYRMLADLRQKCGLPAEPEPSRDEKVEAVLSGALAGGREGGKALREGLTPEVLDMICEQTQP